MTVILIWIFLKNSVVVDTDKHKLLCHPEEKCKKYETFQDFSISPKIFKYLSPFITFTCVSLIWSKWKQIYTKMTFILISGIHIHIYKKYLLKIKLKCWPKTLTRAVCETSTQLCLKINAVIKMFEDNHRSWFPIYYIIYTAHDILFG